MQAGDLNDSNFLNCEQSIDQVLLNWRALDSEFDIDYNAYGCTLNQSPIFSALFAHLVEEESISIDPYCVQLSQLLLDDIDRDGMMDERSKSTESLGKLKYSTVKDSLEKVGTNSRLAIRGYTKELNCSYQRSFTEHVANLGNYTHVAEPPYSRSDSSVMLAVTVCSVKKMSTCKLPTSDNLCSIAQLKPATRELIKHHEMVCSISNTMFEVLNHVDCLHGSCDKYSYICIGSDVYIHRTDMDKELRDMESSTPIEPLGDDDVVICGSRFSRKKRRSKTEGNYRDMSDISVRDLLLAEKLVLGRAYPYYHHLDMQIDGESSDGKLRGNCRCCMHYIFFSDVYSSRFDSLSSEYNHLNAYPATIWSDPFKTRKCYICSIYTANVVVYGDRLCYLSPSFMCQCCFHSLHFSLCISSEGSSYYKPCYSDYAVFEYHGEIK